MNEIIGRKQEIEELQEYRGAFYHTLTLDDIF